jgi:hypothetical protein
VIPILQSGLEVDPVQSLFVLAQFGGWVSVSEAAAGFRNPRLHRINQSNPESRRVGERQVSLIRQRTKSLRSSSDLLTATGRYLPMHNVPSRLRLCNSGGPE